MIKWLFAGVSWRFYYHMQVVYHELLCLVVADHGIHTFCGPYSNSICPRTNFARPWVCLWTTPLVQMVKQHFPSFLCPIFWLLFHPVGTVILVNLHLLDGFGKLQVKSPLTCSMCGFFLPCGRLKKAGFYKVTWAPLIPSVFADFAPGSWNPSRGLALAGCPRWTRRKSMCDPSVFGMLHHSSNS